MTESETLRLEKLVLVLGTTLGQIAELLNYMKREGASLEAAYISLLDIEKAAALQCHAIYYKDKDK